MGYYTKYYTLGLPSFLIVIIALYLLFTGMYVPQYDSNIGEIHSYRLR